MAKSPGLACSAAQQRLGLGRHLSFPSCSAAAHTAKQAGADLVGEIGLRSTLDPGLTALITTITIDRLAGRPTKSVPAAYGATICCPGFVRRCVSWKRQMSIIRRHHSAPVASDKSTNAHPGRTTTRGQDLPTVSIMANTNTAVLDYAALPKIEEQNKCKYLTLSLPQPPPISFFPLFSSYIYNLVNNAATLRYTTLAVLRDFAADGVVYLELRTTPRAMPAAGLTEAGYVQTILDGIAEYEREPPRSENGVGLRTKLILSIDRRHAPTQAARVLALAKQFLGRGVVGIDLCGEPATPLDPELSPSREAKPGQAGMTLHLPSRVLASDAELDTLLGWRPDRIGHVICVSDRVRRGDYGEAWDRVGAVPQLGMLTRRSHFVGVVEDTGDGSGTERVFESPLSNEYALVAQHFGLDRSQICALVRRGVDIIFGGEEEKKRLREILWVE
ncbi:hypothetical protein CHGG_03113 [Chaetomium globosum CBS 148.51]|uniref:Adenosine deaminase domain-containing protein n=1 Tax=Chaetomium globosum (strain ATCC 6205 / CBS 148.51 / DSM 1962 / NBRC 6347 / NRRL 1970) TaxID=306901 RepID=Q2H9J1_CHAGB|nr:uncharacterized protein CHGG_03113 [Chaetomium globosum CBS 148.51]EAQ91178.1 hypothetical protein CHGG_03113 [Chaetomium globosum CBS 148.51]